MNATCPYCGQQIEYTDTIQSGWLTCPNETCGKSFSLGTKQTHQSEKPAKSNQLPLILSIIALALSIISFLHPRFHKSIKDFDFSTPATALRSLQIISQSDDPQLNRELNKIMSDKDDGLSYLLCRDPKEFEIVKTIETSNSGSAKNNGILVSFIKQKRPDSVEIYLVQAFQKNSQGQFIPTYYPNYVMDDQKTDEDKRMEALIQKWTLEGKLD